MPRPHGPGRSPRTRTALLDLLKREGPSDASALAGRLGLTPMAIRQHLYDLRRRRLVEFREEPRPLGRPAKVWRLTAAANAFFPDAHASLAVDLVGAVRASLGARGIDLLLAERARVQADQYRRRVAARAPLQARVEALARIRTEEGYMAEVQAQPNRSLLLVENHCPICLAASACQGLCGAELAVFRRVLGPRVSVERTEHILAGARRCAYRIDAAAGPRKGAPRVPAPQR